MFSFSFINHHEFLFIDWSPWPIATIFSVRPLILPLVNRPPSVPSGLLVARHQFARIHLLLLLLYMHIQLYTVPHAVSQRIYYNKANTARLLMILGLLVVVPRCISLLFVSFTILVRRFLPCSTLRSNPTLLCIERVDDASDNGSINQPA